LLGNSLVDLFDGGIGAFLYGVSGRGDIIGQLRFQARE
jgi:hypothetical protein